METEIEEFQLNIVLQDTFQRKKITELINKLR